MKILEEKDLWWQDRFELLEDHGYWLYYNADGNEGNGQIVEVCIYPWNVMLDAKDEDEFWDHLISISPTYLHDRGCDDFDDYVSTLLNHRENSENYHNDVAQDTMQWLIDWAKKYTY